MPHTNMYNSSLSPERQLTCFTQKVIINWDKFWYRLDLNSKPKINLHLNYTRHDSNRTWSNLIQPQDTSIRCCFVDCILEILSEHFIHFFHSRIVRKWWWRPTWFFLTINLLNVDSVSHDLLSLTMMITCWSLICGFSNSLGSKGSLMQCSIWIIKDIVSTDALVGIGTTNLMLHLPPPFHLLLVY